MTLDIGTNLARFSSLGNGLNLLFLGVIASAACFVLWNVACKALGVVRTTVCLYMTPIIGALFAVFFLHEPITGMSAAGQTSCIADNMPHPQPSSRPQYRAAIWTMLKFDARQKR